MQTPLTLYFLITSNLTSHPSTQHHIIPCHHPQIPSHIPPYHTIPIDLFHTNFINHFQHIQPHYNIISIHPFTRPTNHPETKLSCEKEGGIWCVSRHECVLKHQICDHVRNCPDNSDEIKCGECGCGVGDVVGK